MAQLSGIDWKMLKLQKYVSLRVSSSDSNSSGTYSSLRTICRIFEQMPKNSRSARLRCSRLQ